MVCGGAGGFDIVLSGKQAKGRAFYPCLSHSWGLDLKSGGTDHPAPRTTGVLSGRRENRPFIGSALRPAKIARKGLPGDSLRIEIVSLRSSYKPHLFIRFLGASPSKDTILDTCMQIDRSIRLISQSSRNCLLSVAFCELHGKQPL